MLFARFVLYSLTIDVVSHTPVWTENLLCTILKCRKNNCTSSCVLSLISDSQSIILFCSCNMKKTLIKSPGRIAVWSYLGSDVTLPFQVEQTAAHRVPSAHSERPQTALLEPGHWAHLQTKNTHANRQDSSCVRDTLLLTNSSRIFHCIFNGHIFSIRLQMNRNTKHGKQHFTDLTAILHWTM